MGVGGSRDSGDMSNWDQGSERRRSLRSASRGNSEEAASELNSLLALAYLIRRGQIRFINQDNEDSDGDLSDNDFVAPKPRAPLMDTNPDVGKLKLSDIYSLVMKSSGRLSDNRWRHWYKPTIPNLIAKREIGLNKEQQFTHGDMCLASSKYLPNQNTLLDSYNQKAFCGIYSEDGSIFLSACQDKNIRVYDSSNSSFRLIRNIRARDVGWSVLDTAFSPDGQYVAYSSWSDCVHLCSIFGDYDVHEALPFCPGEPSFCIFSLMFSLDNKEILGGANDGNLYVYDRESNKRTLKIDAHDSDVNTVRFADSSSQILYSGSDDGLCKVWDRRALSEERPIPVGVLAGHSDGITYIDSKGDARFFISNSKDQSLKLWDLRYFSDEAGIEETKKVVSSQRWDYRWQQVPRRMSKGQELKGDSSVMTYRGHCVLHTLIRCKFSPEATTGQRYIYTGCATGGVVIYDLLSGKVVRKLEGHKSCVRDVSWHPYQHTIVSTSWDGQLYQWTYADPNAQEIESQDMHRPHRVTRCHQHHTREVPFPGLFD